MPVTFLTNEDKTIIDQSITQLSEEMADLNERLAGGSSGTNLVNLDEVIRGGLVSGTSIRSDGSFANYVTSGYISVDANTDYILTVRSEQLGSLTAKRKMYCLYDSSKTPISDSYKNIEGVEQIPINSGTAAYVRVSGQVDDPSNNVYGAVLQLELASEFTGDTLGTSSISLIAPDMLRGKKWVIFGDSFTNGGYNASDGYEANVYKFQSGKFVGKNIVYPYIIAERTGINIVSFFQGGRTLANPADGSFTNSITNPSGNCYYQTIPEDADYITIYLGINDSHHESGTSGTDGEDVTGVIPLGTIDDTDASTFFGAWNVVLPWLMTNRPNAHIGIIVSNGVDRVEYRTATIAAAKKWGIPYLDLNGDERCPAMIRSKNPDVSDAAKAVIDAKWRVTETNTHPNTAAHYFQSTFIENWLRTL